MTNKNLKKILVLDELCPPYDQIKVLESGILLVKEPGVLEVDQLISRVKQDPLIKGIICSLTQKINEKVFQELPQIEVISNIAVGLNNIDLEAAKKYGVRIAHTPKVLSDATADLAWALLLGGSRRLAEGDRLARSGEWKGWAVNQLLGPSLGFTENIDQNLGQKRLGIIGLGQIGQAIARRAQGFNLDVCYYNRTRYVELEQSYSWGFMDLDELLMQSDYIILAVALAPETYHLLNRTRLNLMKPNAYLVNVGRGPLLDEEALIDCLESGHLSGAALDVYEYEPNIPERLRALSQVTLSPHLGSATFETRQAMSRLVIESAESIIQGKEPCGYFAI